MSSTSSWTPLNQSTVERALRDNQQLRRDLQNEVSSSNTFDAMDADHNGVVDREEFRNYMNRTNPASLQRPAAPTMEEIESISRERPANMAYKSFFAKASSHVCPAYPHHVHIGPG